MSKHLKDLDVLGLLRENGQRVSVWLNGTGAPASGLGNMGNFYVDTANGKVYQKTSLTVWSNYGTLKSAEPTVYTQAGKDTIDVISVSVAAGKSFTFAAGRFVTPGASNPVIVTATPVGSNPAAVSPLTVSTTSASGATVFGVRLSGSTDIDFYWTAMQELA